MEEPPGRGGTTGTMARANQKRKEKALRAPTSARAISSILSRQSLDNPRIPSPLSRSTRRWINLDPSHWNGSGARAREQLCPPFPSARMFLGNINSRGVIGTVLAPVSRFSLSPLSFFFFFLCMDPN